jgi:putative hydrolase of the HAD superfamily
VPHRVVLWDFDGTLAQRPGMWSSCVMEVLDEAEPRHAVSLGQIRAGLKNGFPWHSPYKPHAHLGDPEAWWQAVGALLEAAIEAVGFAPARARELAKAVRVRYVDGRYGWHLFDDTMPALTAVADHGWRSVVVSNHVPELPELAEHLGLMGPIDAVFTSARTGFEKPHPEAFRIALRACGEPEMAWMVGDNPVADVAGAEAIGLPAILARTADPSATLRAADLNQAAAMIIDGATHPY